MSWNDECNCTGDGAPKDTSPGPWHLKSCPRWRRGIDRCVACGLEDLSQSAGECAEYELSSTHGLRQKFVLCSGCGAKWIFRVGQVLGNMLRECKIMVPKNSQDD